MRTNDETENELENRTEGAEDEEPGNPKATTTRTFPSKKVAKHPTSKVPISKSGGHMSKTQPKGKFVTSSRPGSTMVKSKGGKARSGKKWKKGGAGKQPPTVQQKMKSFGGMY